MNTLSFVEIFIIAIGVSMDAFAVAICKGLSFKDHNNKKAFIMAAYFGFFQALMPLIGYLLGVRFQDSINSIDHWIAFILLASIGLNMIKESHKSKKSEWTVFQDDKESVVKPCSCDEGTKDGTVDFKTMVVLALATSIDALAVGVTFAFLKVDLLPSVSLIGITTFVVSFIGAKIGIIFGVKFKYRAEFFGGIVLIFMAFEILFDHLGIIII